MERCALALSARHCIATNHTICQFGTTLLSGEGKQLMMRVTNKHLFENVLFLLAMELLYKSNMTLVVGMVLTDILPGVIADGTQPSASCLWPNHTREDVS